MDEQKTLLNDGSRVTLRRARPGDISALAALFNRLSSQTRYMRFMKFRDSISETVLVRFLEAQGTTFAIVAEIEVGSEKKLIADARYVVDSLPGEAGLGIVVEDAYQRLGLGNKMLSMLIEHARQSGIAFFIGQVLSENDIFCHLFLATSTIAATD